jgi:protein adenylyltransferase
MLPLTGLAFDNSYARLHPDFFEVVEPTPLPDPYLVAFNPDAAALLDLDPVEGHERELPRYLGGGGRIPGSEPIAQAYAGHQFGVWVPRLGDGRAFLLGEVRNRRGESWDLHLKGGGQTRYSRGGDGRSVLRSAIREYLASEALHGLGIPTTRALAVVGSGLPVRRERIETAATLLRLAPSHVRFGTFQYFAARGRTERVRELADHVIARHFPDLGDPREKDRYRRFFGEACRRTGALVARWMASGFAHGVMNTDNMSVLGVTLDYGPYGFMDGFDPGFIPNHSDTEGRYAFDQQPAVGLWNCARLGEALLPLLELEAAEAELQGYRETFATEYGRLMRARLGLASEREEDAALVREALALMQAGGVDYTRFFRDLNCVNSQQSTVDSAVPARFSDRAGIAVWLERYAARLRAEGSVDAERAERMRRVNPKYVLRNWLAQEAIEAAERKEFELVEALRRLFAAPFDEHPGMQRYAGPPAAGAPDLEVSCSS